MLLHTSALVVLLPDLTPQPCGDFGCAMDVGRTAALQCVVFGPLCLSAQHNEVWDCFEVLLQLPVTAQTIAMTGTQWLQSQLLDSHCSIQSESCCAAMPVSRSQ
jgi:hypothetical protein